MEISTLVKNSHKPGKTCASKKNLTDHVPLLWNCPPELVEGGVGVRSLKNRNYEHIF